jgi:hypothetical protein
MLVPGAQIPSLPGLGVDFDGAAAAAPFDVDDLVSADARAPAQSRYRKEYKEVSHTVATIAPIAGPGKSPPGLLDPTR